MRLNNIIYSIIFLLTLSCLPGPKEAKKFSTTLRELTWEAQSIEFHDEKMFSDQILLLPPFTWRLLLSLDTNICLFYRTPLDSDTGTLRIVQTKERPCFGESYDEFLIAELNNIKDLGFKKVARRESYLQQENEILISAQWRQSTFEWKLNFPLVKSTKDLENPEKLMSSAVYLGNTLNPFIKSNKLIGSWEQRYSDGDFSFCHRVDKDCQDIVEFKCSECRFGWVEVVDHFCPQGGSKICGRNRCGERGEPACLRGRSFLEENVDGPCFADSTAGFCGPGLSIVCDENQILICL
jgi:hypothetical protein